MSMPRAWIKRHKMQKGGHVILTTGKGGEVIVRPLVLPENYEENTDNSNRHDQGTKQASQEGNES